MQLAPGVSFDETKHEYWYKGKQLSGVTGLISKKLGLKYFNDYVGEHTEEGIHVHKAIQRWIETGDSGSIHPGVTWLTEELGKLCGRSYLLAETLVSDFHKYASAVDIIAQDDDGLVICDIKKGKFNREYVTWQLSIYKYLIERLVFDADTSNPPYLMVCDFEAKKWHYIVKNCVCICLKDKEFYPIFPKSTEDVEKLLYGINVKDEKIRIC